MKSSFEGIYDALLYSELYYDQEIDEIDKVNIGIFSKYKINRNIIDMVGENKVL